MMPIAAIAGEAGGLDAEHRPDRAGADGGDQLLEAWTLHYTGARPAQVFIDHLDRCETCRMGLVRKAILPPLALGVAKNLRHGGLAHVDHGATGQVLSGNLTAHRRPPSALRPRHGPWLLEAAPPAPRQLLPAPQPLSAAAIG